MNERGASPSVPAGRLVRAWRNLAPGLAVTLAAVAFFAAGGEFYFRATAPKAAPTVETIFDPRVGGLFRPGSEAVLTNGLDYLTRQRANAFGFLDREPSPAAARPGRCHVVLIGDSFVEAQQVAIDDKIQVVLEREAAGRHPELKLTTSAFGLSDTGQINQLPFYDHFARDQAPRVVVLVFVKNDFADNSAVIQGIQRGRDPDHMPRLFARRGADGVFALKPIDPDWASRALPAYDGTPNPARGWLLRTSLFYRWIEENAWRAALLAGRWWRGPSRAAAGAESIGHFARLLASRPGYAGILDGWDPADKPAVDEVFFEEKLPPLFEEAVELTGFALDRFLDRARRDGFRLVILATQTMKREDGNTRAYERMAALARARAIPVIDLHAHILAKGGRIGDARFRYDGHWSPQGHIWAAQALLDHIARNPDYCRSD